MGGRFLMSEVLLYLKLLILTGISNLRGDPNHIHSRMRHAGGIGQGTKLNLKDSGRRAEDQPLALRVVALNRAGLERDLGYHSSGDGVRFEPRGPGRVLGS